MKEVIKGFKRGLLWCAVIFSGILVVTIAKVVAGLWEESAEAYKHRYDPPNGAMF